MRKSFLIIPLVLAVAIASQAKKIKTEDPKGVLGDICTDLNNRKTHDLDMLKPNCTKTAFDMMIAMSEEMSHTPKSDKDKFSYLKVALKVLKRTMIEHEAYPQTQPPVATTEPYFELSGFVVDHKRNVLWGIGDEENKIIKVDLATKQVEQIEILGAQNQNWEAVTLDPEQDRLWILDTGDNDDNRPHVAFIACDLKKIKDQKLKIDKTFLVKYEKGPEDVESGAFYKGKIYLFGRHLFESVNMTEVTLPKDIATSKTELVGKNIGKVGVGPSITDASFTPDGHLYLLSFFDLSELVNWQSPEKRERKIIKKFFFGQQEALGAVGNNKFMIGTEGGKIFELTPGQ